jgi:hypothetical protein
MSRFRSTQFTHSLFLVNLLYEFWMLIIRIFRSLVFWKREALTNALSWENVWEKQVSYSLTHSLTHSHSHSLTHSLTHSLIHFQNIFFDLKNKIHNLQVKNSLQHVIRSVNSSLTQSWAPNLWTSKHSALTLTLTHRHTLSFHSNSLNQSILHVHFQRNYQFFCFWNISD